MKESFLIDVLKKGVSPFHCVEAAMETLEESGFEELEYAYTQYCFGGLE